MGETTAAGPGDASTTQQYSLYKPVPVLSDAPLSDVLYIKEHQAEFPGVATVQTTQRSYPQVELPGPAQGYYPAAQVLGYVGTINSAELASRAVPGLPGRGRLRAVRPRVPVRDRAPRHTREPAARGRPPGPGGRRAEVDPARPG